MHIISGIYKGREIKKPAFIRPTSSLVRESMFNIIGDEIIGARALDLFSGSGAIGIEAFSRGAQCVTFVEKNKRVVKILRDNIKNLGIGDSKIINMDALRFSIDTCYDVIFADPPYDRGYAMEVADKFAESARIVVIEHSVREVLEVGETRRYGDTLVTYFWNQQKTFLKLYNIKLSKNL